MKTRGNDEFFYIFHSFLVSLLLHISSPSSKFFHISMRFSFWVGVLFREEAIERKRKGQPKEGRLKTTALVPVPPPSLFLSHFSLFYFFLFIEASDRISKERMFCLGLRESHNEDVPLDED